MEYSPPLSILHLPSVMISPHSSRYIPPRFYFAIAPLSATTRPPQSSNSPILEHIMIQKASSQFIILKLQDFWALHGCLITQPYYTQIGAGTMNPTTFLRVLGPEPCNVANVEPSVGPMTGVAASLNILTRVAPAADMPTRTSLQNSKHGRWLSQFS